MNFFVIIVVIYAIAGGVLAALVFGSDLVLGKITNDFILWFFGWGVLVVALAIGQAVKELKQK